MRNYLPNVFTPALVKKSSAKVLTDQYVLHVYIKVSTLDSSIRLQMTLLMQKYFEFNQIRTYIVTGLDMIYT